MKRERYYCPACEVVGDKADYIEHDDHTCGNCGDDYLVPVVITDEGDLLGEALEVCDYALAFCVIATCEHANQNEAGRQNAQRAVDKIRAVLAKAGK